MTAKAIEIIVLENMLSELCCYLNVKVGVCRFTKIQWIMNNAIFKKKKYKILMELGRSFHHLDLRDLSHAMLHKKKIINDPKI